MVLAPASAPHRARTLIESDLDSGDLVLIEEPVLDLTALSPSGDPAPEHRAPDRRPPPGADLAEPTKTRAEARAQAKQPPVIRLGLAWTSVLVVAIAVSPTLAAVVLVPVAAVAATSAWRHLDAHQPRLWWLAALAAGLGPLTAVAGPIPALGVVLAGGLALPAVTARQAPWPDQLKLAVCVMAPAAGAASLVLASRQSVTVGLALLSAVSLFDASNHVMGVGKTGGLLGAMAGAVSLAVLSLLLAGILVVPFRGLSPWLLCGAVAVTAPLSVGAAHRLVGGARLPAWRRLDALFVAGPLWVIGAQVLLHP